MSTHESYKTINIYLSNTSVTNAIQFQFLTCYEFSVPYVCSVQSVGTIVVIRL